MQQAAICQTIQAHLSVRGMSHDTSGWVWGGLGALVWGLYLFGFHPVISFSLIT